ncbi:NADP-dependent oxidoreductase [Actinoplanes sp. TBRC 11911]|uniref:NADP-dependent oxidoreductase n=1 Tax=Actinoplanes sp. TBRC 11911 TaxID=2729386 RepID=UPI00145FAC80|nr:NADP-dependent oxidoreductase [Actinoplanes sp. TBRC 11911]NMO55360.1 NADP-dependent oxidoreductase [Actinoplanes sp. TBRC 11911]
MKAIALDEFGDYDVMKLRELPDPLVPGESVRISVKAVGVNRVDSVIRAGDFNGYFPSHVPLIPGWDVAGVIDTVGVGVTRFEPGDEVMAYAQKDSLQFGTYAELVTVTEGIVARKPAALTFAQAGSLPLAGLTAWQALQAVAVGIGDVVLVHAASGGVGHLAVQLARTLGASRVIGTASIRNHDFLRSLGVEPVEYGPDLPSRLAELLGGDGRVDAVLDLMGGEALKQSFLLVRNPVRLVSVVDPAVKAQGGRFVFARPDGVGLGRLAELADLGRLWPEVTKELPLEQAVEAQRLVDDGHTRGKIVLIP